MELELKQKIQSYIPFNKQEENEKEEYLKFINTYDDVLTRKTHLGISQVRHL